MSAQLDLSSIFDPKDLAWGYPPFPDWLIDFRPTQLEAAQQALEAFEAGYKVVMCEAPTGAGKTVVGELVRRVLPGHRALYLVGTKQLQTQIEDRFPYAAVLWGRANYPVRNEPELFPYFNAGLCDKSPDHQCDLCSERDPFDDEDWMGCSFCCPLVSECPYEMAKSHALSSKLAVVNYSYFLVEANHVGRFGEQENKKTGRKWRQPFIIGDEADVIEQELMSHVEVNISERRRRQFNINPPAKKTVESAYLDWVQETDAMLKYRGSLLPTQTRDPEKIKTKQWVERTRGQLKHLARGLQEGGWVYDEGRGDQIIFRPARVDQEAQRNLWRHGDRWLLMSATICAPEIMAQDLGLEDGEWTSFSLPSSFDPKRRPIYVTPRANMTNKMKDAEWPKMAEGVAELLRTYEGERVLIPTVSYALNSFLWGQLEGEFGRRLITYTSAQQRVDALKKYRKMKGAVLLAPSMDRGVDMADEDCRCIIIVKVPYLNLGDRQVSKRLYSKGGQEWFTVSAIRRLVQMTGRGMRHAGDYVDTFILDGQFTKLYASYGRWFPRWWKEAIDWKRGGRDALRSRGGAAVVAGGGN